MLHSDINAYYLGMEASALQDFLNWSEREEILKLITVVCCDKDSSTHKLINEDPRYVCFIYFLTTYFTDVRI